MPKEKKKIIEYVSWTGAEQNILLKRIQVVSEGMY